ncbi:DUF2634 domain-containing protein [Listeria monocytogenes]|uniref:DUF2634 domain-containing protein n=1 Tax=Listeria monocytogenes TaxID=1639 RepID=UPI0010B47155|nr:DUF2634 domain-containing protein [Listeria monocytogenes]ECX5716888.1 DUF2634 domain-containing protein [Listeria monocytogenes]EDN7364746.1 DUF2634 domain-containing protein [Listeria monocytogenes]EDN7445966.1 DUF2634 domain-containing protein [Listeria monocytogenes]EDO1010964.1 DUF2634 domain-containing protein [Listeria monocytogenes]
MKDLLISTDGDLLIERNEIMMTDGIDDIIQSVRLILLTHQGEFYFDQNSGLVYENLFSKSPNFDYIKQDIITAITEQEERVSSVDSVLFNFNKPERKLFVSIKMTADDIPVSIEEVILNA